MKITIQNISLAIAEICLNDSNQIKLYPDERITVNSDGNIKLNIRHVFKSYAEKKKKGSALYNVVLSSSYEIDNLNDNDTLLISHIQTDSKNDCIYYRFFLYKNNMLLKDIDIEVTAKSTLLRKYFKTNIGNLLIDFFLETVFSGAILIFVVLWLLLGKTTAMITFIVWVVLFVITQLTATSLFNLLLTLIGKLFGGKLAEIAKDEKTNLPKMLKKKYINQIFFQSEFSGL